MKHSQTLMLHTQMSIIDKIDPFKVIRAKQQSEDWFDGEILESILIRDKLFKKFKNTKLYVDKQIYNVARNKVQNLKL